MVLREREPRVIANCAHIGQLRKRAAEAEAKLKRLYDAIENGVADLADPMPKDRIAELKAVRDRARSNAEIARGRPSLADPEDLLQAGPQTHAD
jgi:site-specific DNA recombinase